MHECALHYRSTGGHETRADALAGEWDTGRKHAYGAASVPRMLLPPSYSWLSVSPFKVQRLFHRRIYSRISAEPYAVLHKRASSVRFSCAASRTSLGCVEGYGKCLFWCRRCCFLKTSRELSSTRDFFLFANTFWGLFLRWHRFFMIICERF